MKQATAAHRFIIAAIVFTAMSASPAARAGGDPTGVWQVEDRSAIVQIASCGPALCGTIIWSEKPTDAKGEKLCNMAVLGDAVPSGPDSWDKGWVYAPKAGSTYPVSLKLAGDDTLHLHITAGLFGRDQTWTRPMVKVAPCSP